VSVYGLLRKFLPAPAAIVAFACLYAVLIAAILLLLPTPAADFRYSRY
jgi:hypothetical protein